MSARLADRQIRAAAFRAAPTLDVRGPVSEALGRAGIVVPPATAPPETAAPLPALPRPALSRTTAGGVAAPEPVVKPFEAAPWSTRAGRDDPERALSGLTADERRVHRILLDSLDRDSRQGYGNGTGVTGLSYAENKRLKVLDLAFINAQLAKMDRTAEAAVTIAKWGGAVGLAALLATMAVLAVLGDLALAALIGGSTVMVALLLGPALAGLSTLDTGESPRRQIYEALRELALLVDDAPVSTALDEADRLIDAFADPAPPTGTAAPPRRVRS